MHSRADNLFGGYVPSQAITPIAAMPAEHPAVKQELCGTRLAAGDPIPIEGMSLFNNALECAPSPGANLFYGFMYPYGYSANTGYYAAETATVYMIIDAGAHGLPAPTP